MPLDGLQGVACRTPSKDEDAKAQLLQQTSIRTQAKHHEVVKDSITRDLGTWLQVRMCQAMLEG